MSDSSWTHGLYSPWNTPGQNTGVGCLSLLQRDLSNPGIEPRSPALQADSLPAEPQRKPKNTGVGSLSLFQGIFPTQESNRGPLHCRWILYQLSYQESPHPLLELSELSDKFQKALHTQALESDVCARLAHSRSVFSKYWFSSLPSMNPTLYIFHLN